MAVMGKEIYLSKRGGITHSYIVKFSQKNKRFFIIVPLEFEIVRDKSASWSGKIFGDTYDGVRSEFMELADKYYATTLICEKVIIYKVPVNNPNNFKNKGIIATMSYAPKIAIGVDYKIKYKITMGDRVLISGDQFDNLQQRSTFSTNDKEYEEIKQVQSKGWKIINHTDEMEQWFVDFGKKLIKLIENVEEFFGEDEQSLLDNIKNNKLGNKLIQ